MIPVLLVLDTCPFGASLLDLWYLIPDLTVLDTLPFGTWRDALRGATLQEYLQYHTNFISYETAWKLKRLGLKQFQTLVGADVSPQTE